MSRSWALRAWALLAACSATASGAEVGGARLSVARSADALSCPDDEVLAARVRQLRDGKADVPPLRIDVLLQRHAEGYRARIRVSGPRSGERELTTQEGSCGGLADALSVSLALLLDEEALPAPPPASPPAPERAPGGVGSGPFVAPPASAGGWLLSLGGGLGLGLPSGVSLLVLPGLRYRSEGSRWGVGGRWAWSPEQRRGFEGGQVAVALWRGEVEGCWRLVERGWERGGWELAGCAVAAVGRLEGGGRGFAPDRSASRPYYALGAAAVATGAVSGGWFWFGRGAPLIPLSRERFVVDGRGVAYALPGLGVEAAVGVERRF